MPTLPLYQVDAFANRPFTGNPAAVVPLEAPIPEALMQDVAAENNLSETAFFHRQGDAFSLRWFTPKVEVELCGHATVAAALGARPVEVLRGPAAVAVFETADDVRHVAPDMAALVRAGLSLCVTAP